MKKPRSPSFTEKITELRRSAASSRPEYLIITLAPSIGPYEGQRANSRTLTEYSASGWDLVTVAVEGHTHYAYLKRESPSMSRTRAEHIVILELHRENLQACTTFEDYKRCHIAFVTWVIDDYSAQEAKEQADKDFVNDTEFVTKTQWRVVDEQGETATDPPKALGCPRCGLAIGPHSVACPHDDCPYRDAK